MYVEAEEHFLNKVTKASTSLWPFNYMGLYHWEPMSTKLESLVPTKNNNNKKTTKHKAVL